MGCSFRFAQKAPKRTYAAVQEHKTPLCISQRGVKLPKKPGYRTTPVSRRFMMHNSSGRPGFLVFSQVTVARQRRTFTGFAVTTRAIRNNGYLS